MTTINSRYTVHPACKHVDRSVCTFLEATTDHLAAVKAKVDKRLSA